MPRSVARHRVVALALALALDGLLPFEPHDAGFGTAQSMRQHLQGVLGVTSTAYRRMFRTDGARRYEDAP